MTVINKKTFVKQDGWRGGGGGGGERENSNYHSHNLGLSRKSCHLVVFLVNNFEHERRRRRKKKHTKLNMN